VEALSYAVSMKMLSLSDAFLLLVTARLYSLRKRGNGTLPMGSDPGERWRDVGTGTALSLFASTCRLPEP
jgi:hypothetical protein